MRIRGKKRLYHSQLLYGIGSGEFVKKFSGNARGEVGDIEVKEVKEALQKVKEGKIRCEEISRKVRLFLIQENILFYNPLEGVVRPQSKLLLRAMRRCVDT